MLKYFGILFFHVIGKKRNRYKILPFLFCLKHILKYVFNGFFVQ